MAGSGRPRNPALDGKIVEAATRVIGTIRLSDFTVNDVVALAGIGKASVYRRWRTTHALLVDVVADLGVRDVAYGDGPGTTRGDLVTLLHAVTHGRRALAEAALLPEIGLHDDLRAAYYAGPVLRLNLAAADAADRAVTRGEWLPGAPVLAAAALLMQRVQVAGVSPSDGDIGGVVDHVVLPALRPAAVTA